ncbi:C-type lectin domain family 7 member A-like [Melanotaenia boesemani]|uniref:C-type lectin domain family 7 member A-like n=1 Tax=Melanotaenia boesemani TaxID=1250792 RepID=UPI001C0478A6|nr:C-type lectin domain family 7 member A-like [Melanotaenia boesemani]
MSEDNITYTDVTFKKTTAKDALPSSDDITYSEIKIEKSELHGPFPSSGNSTHPEVKTVKSELPGLKQQAGSNRKRHVTSARAALLVLILLLVAAVVILGVTVMNNSVMERISHTENKQLKEEIEALKKNLSGNGVQTRPPSPTCPTCPPSTTCPPPPSCPPPSTCPPPPTCPLPSTCPPPGLNLNETRLKCEAGWEPHGEKCYYFNTTKSSWNDSRDGCKLKGGDLVKIDSREEQKFLEARLREKMEEAEDKFWIGLTDSEEEGRWLWVDGSSLDTCLSFWSINEPDNFEGENPDGEDCARMGEKGGAADLKCWFDRNCNVPQKSICEKAAETRRI